MGIMDKIRGAKEKVHEYKEQREERGHEKRESKREEFEERKKAAQEKLNYYKEKHETQRLEAKAREERIYDTPVVGRLYSAAQSFDAKKFAKATVAETRRPNPAILSSQMPKKSKRQSFTYAQPQPNDYGMNYGYNPVEANLRAMQMPSSRETRSIGVFGQTSRRAPSLKSISPSGSVSFAQPKIDKRFRKLMGV